MRALRDREHARRHQARAEVSRSAATVCAVRPRGQQQRYVIVRVAIGNAEPDRHRVQKGWIRQGHATLSEVLASVKDQFIPCLQQVSWLHHRAVYTAVAIGYHLADSHSVTGDRIKPEELDTHAGRRAPVHDVENVGRQPTTSYRHVLQASGIAVHHETDAAVGRSGVAIGHDFAAILGPDGYVPQSVLCLKTDADELRKPRQHALAHLPDKVLN